MRGFRHSPSLCGGIQPDDPPRSEHCLRFRPRRFYLEAPGIPHPRGESGPNNGERPWRQPGRETPEENLYAMIDEVRWTPLNRGGSAIEPRKKDSNRADIPGSTLWARPSSTKFPWPARDDHHPRYVPCFGGPRGRHRSLQVASADHTPRARVPAPDSDGTS